MQLPVDCIKWREHLSIRRAQGTIHPCCCWTCFWCECLKTLTTHIKNLNPNSGNCWWLKKMCTKAFTRQMLETLKSTSRILTQIWEIVGDLKNCVQRHSQDKCLKHLIHIKNLNPNLGNCWWLKKCVQRHSQDKCLKHLIHIKNLNPILGNCWWLQKCVQSIHKTNAWKKRLIHIKNLNPNLGIC
jgi:hypothetical protein